MAVQKCLKMLEVGQVGGESPWAAWATMGHLPGICHRWANLLQDFEQLAAGDQTKVPWQRSTRKMAGKSTREMSPRRSFCCTYSKYILNIF